MLWESLSNTLQFYTNKCKASRNTSPSIQGWLVSPDPFLMGGLGMAINYKYGEDKIWMNQNFTCNVKLVKKQSKPNRYDCEHENETVMRQPWSCVFIAHFLSGFLELKIADYNLACLAYAETWCEDNCWNSLIDVVDLKCSENFPYIWDLWDSFIKAM